MIPKRPGHSRFLIWQIWSSRGLRATSLSFLVIAFGASCGNKMSFNATQTSFRQFSKCVLADDFASRKLEYRDAWLQNVVSAQEFMGQESQGEGSDSEESTDEAYVITGVVRTASTDASTRDNLTILLVRKVVDTYKVVNWATNIGQEDKHNLQELSLGLLFNPYEGRCSW
jgi:hypothetical protein